MSCATVSSTKHGRTFSFSIAYWIVEVILFEGVMLVWVGIDTKDRKPPNPSVNISKVYNCIIRISRRALMGQNADRLPPKHWTHVSH